MPRREYEWIEVWDCEILHSDSGFAEKGCVFRTLPPWIPSGEVWVVSRYEPNRRIEFVRTNTASTICQSITLHDNDDGTSRAVNEYLMVGLTEEGNRMVEEMSERIPFELKVGMALLNHYLTTGKRLPMKDALAAASGA